MRSLQLEALELRALDLRGCGHLDSLALHCPKLLSLDATFCKDLGEGPARLLLPRRKPAPACLEGFGEQLGRLARRAAGTARLGGSTSAP
jgi:hypothetical protein